MIVGPRSQGKRTGALGWNPGRWQCLIYVVNSPPKKSPAMSMINIILWYVNKIAITNIFTVTNMIVELLSLVMNLIFILAEVHGFNGDAAGFELLLSIKTPEWNLASFWWFQYSESCWWSPIFSTVLVSDMFPNFQKHVIHTCEIWTHLWIIYNH